MKPKIVLLLLCTVSLAAATSGLILARRAPANHELPPGAVTYQVRGEIRGLDLEERTVRIAHEEIPDYMPAMIMPFSVRNGSLLKGLRPGDRVNFELAVTDDDSWISALDKEPLEIALASNGGIAPEDESQRVIKGEPMPEFGLIDQQGQPIKLSDFRGKAVLITFIYTRCPLPNFCPLMSKNFADLQSRLSKKLPNKYHLLSVTMDPAFDQPAVLKDYAARYGADEKDWSFATGTPEQITEVAAAMGLHYQWENGLISHDLRTALVGPDGRLVHLWKSNVWTPYEVERMVLEVMEQGKALAAR